MNRVRMLLGRLSGKRVPLSLVLALAALVLALARPTLPVTREVYRHIVVVDITQSMNVQDYQVEGRPVSRLEQVKRALRETLPELPCGSEVGLAIFSEHRAFLLFAPMEICANFSAILPTIDRLEWRMAWVGNSEVSKGLYEGLRVARQFGPQTNLVFITDGHEAPPVNPRYRPVFHGTPGEVAGVIVGVGGPTPVPIPKYDLSGRFVGYWSRDEVPQTDPYRRGRGGSVAGESMVGLEDVAPVPEWNTGNEHLSSLREGYLKQLAQETGLHYRRLSVPKDLAAALRQPQFVREVRAEAEVGWVFGAFALACLIAAHVLPLRRARGYRFPKSGGQ
ncbi:MAG: vWA domain-containing protein [Gammaproteobacteria bacterium]